MSMFDCEKCWDTPCRCGRQYRDWSLKDLRAQIRMLQGVLKDKMKELQKRVKDEY